MSDEFPAAITATRPGIPGPVIWSIACSSSERPSCGPTIVPSERFTTTGRPSSLAFSSTNASAFTTSVDTKPSEPSSRVAFTTIRSAPDARPHGDSSPAAIDSPCVP